MIDVAPVFDPEDRRYILDFLRSSDGRGIVILGGEWGIAECMLPLLEEMVREGLIVRIGSRIEEVTYGLPERDSE